MTSTTITVTFPKRTIDKLSSYVKDNDIRNIYGNRLTIGQTIFSIVESFVSYNCLGSVSCTESLVSCVGGTASP